MRSTLPAYYLAAERLGPVIVHPVKRGPDKGMLAIEEVPSPVFHYERSVPNDEGELVSGRLWAELDVTDDANDSHREAARAEDAVPGDPRAVPEELAAERSEGLLGRPARRRGLEARRAGAARGRAQGPAVRRVAVSRRCRHERARRLTNGARAGTRAA